MCINYELLMYQIIAYTFRWYQYFMPKKGRICPVKVSSGMTDSLCDACKVKIIHILIYQCCAITCDV